MAEPGGREGRRREAGKAQAKFGGVGAVTRLEMLCLPPLRVRPSLRPFLQPVTMFLSSAPLSDISLYHLPSGWAGHRPCTGLWRATLLVGNVAPDGPHASASAVAVLPFKPISFHVRPGASGAPPAPAATPSHQHYPYPSSPYRAGDADRLLIDQVAHADRLHYSSS